MLVSTLGEGLLVGRGSCIKDSLVGRDPTESVVDSQWDILEDCWGMVAIDIHIHWPVILFHEWFVETCSEVHCDV